jgi:hypothetical protein
MVTSDGLTSAKPGSAGDSGKAPPEAGLSLNLKAISVFSPPRDVAAETAPAGDPASDGRIRGPRSIFTFSAVVSGGPTAAEPIGDKTDGNPGTEMVSPARSGSDGLIEKRGFSLTGGGVAWVAPVARDSPGTAGWLEGSDAPGRAGNWASGEAEAGDSVGAGGPPRSLNFIRDSGGDEGSSLMQMRV